MTKARGAIAIVRALGFAALLALALLALLGMAARAQDRAASVRVTVQVPQAPAGVVMLEIGIRAPQGLDAKHPGASVRLRGASGEAIEVGRLSIRRTAVDGVQRYRFDIANAVRRLGLAGEPAEVEVEAVDRAGGTVSAPLTIDAARIVVR